MIRINKVQTDNFQRLFQELAEMKLSISAMDIRKVQNIVADIYKGESGIKVKITEDLDTLSNSDKVLAIGSEKTIKYEFLTTREMIYDYFDIIEERNSQILDTLNKQRVASNQYFPVFAFSLLNPLLKNIDTLKDNQRRKIIDLRRDQRCQYNNINQIIETSMSDENISRAIIWNVLEGNISIDEFKKYILDYKQQYTKTELLSSTKYKRLICVYDYLKYNEETSI